MKTQRAKENKGATHVEEPAAKHTPSFVKQLIGCVWWGSVHSKQLKLSASGLREGVGSLRATEQRLDG